MAAPRQQRTNNARGTLRDRILANAGVLDWVPTTPSGSTVIIGFVDPPVHASLAGIPQMVRSDTNATPTGATWDGSSLTLTFGSAIGAGVTLTLPSRDPAFRGSSGEYLDGKSYTTAALPNPPSVEFFNDGGTPQRLLVCVYDGTSLGAWNVSNGSTVGDWMVLVVPSAAIGGVILSGSITPTTLDAGTIQTFTWDGAQWS